MTNAAVVSRIRSSFKWNHYDSEITDRAVLAELRSTATKYIKQATDKRKLWNSPNIFTNLKVDLEEVRMADYCDFQSECTVARSKYKLPKIAEGIFGLLVSGLYNLNIRRKFIEVSVSRYENIQKMGLPGKDVYYWFFNGYLFVSEPTLESAILPAFTEGDVSTHFNLDCKDAEDDCPKNPMEEEFKCPSYLEQDVINAVVQFYSNTYKRSIQDNTSNELDEGK